MRSLIVAVLMLATVLVTGCATGRADAAGSNPIHAYSGGQFAIERVEKLDNHLEVGAWPAGMENWSPDQITALAAAKAKGEAAVLAEFLTSKQEITPEARGGEGTASATNAPNLNLNLDAVNAARAALGLPPLDRLPGAGTGGTPPGK
jgi:hypothetical protein